MTEDLGQTWIVPCDCLWGRVRAPLPAWHMLMSCWPVFCIPATRLQLSATSLLHFLTRSAPNLSFSTTKLCPMHAPPWHTEPSLSSIFCFSVASGSAGSKSSTQPDAEPLEQVVGGGRRNLAVHSWDWQACRVAEPWAGRSGLQACDTGDVQG